MAVACIDNSGRIHTGQVNQLGLIVSS